MKYLDGNVRDVKGKVTHPKYPESWYASVVKARPDHFLLPDKDPKLNDKERLALPKLPPKKAPASGRNSTCPTPKKVPAPKCTPCQQKKTKGCGCRAASRDVQDSSLPFALLVLLGITLLLRRSLNN